MEVYYILRITVLYCNLFHSYIYVQCAFSYPNEAFEWPLICQCSIPVVPLPASFRVHQPFIIVILQIINRNFARR